MIDELIEDAEYFRNRNKDDPTRFRFFQGEIMVLERLTLWLKGYKPVALVTKEGHVKP
jgi:hypothetical protein